MEGDLIYVDDGSEALYCGACGAIEEDEALDAAEDENEPLLIRAHFMTEDEVGFHCSGCGTYVFGPADPPAPWTPGSRWEEAERRRHLEAT